MTATTVPTNIVLHAQSKQLQLDYANGESFKLSAEFLRVLSPSAEVKGHGPGQEKLQVGKIGVAIKGVEAVGNYAIKLIFSDGHNSGIYTWDYLFDLAHKQESYWNDYLAELEKQGGSRDIIGVVKWTAPAKKPNA